MTSNKPAQSRFEGFSQEEVYEILEWEREEELIRNHFEYQNQSKKDEEEKEPLPVQQRPTLGTQVVCLLQTQKAIHDEKEKQEEEQKRKKLEEECKMASPEEYSEFTKSFEAFFSSIPADKFPVEKRTLRALYSLIIFKNACFIGKIPPEPMHNIMVDGCDGYIEAIKPFLDVVDAFEKSNQTEK